MNALLLVATAGIAGAAKLGHPSGAVSSSPGPHAVFLSYASQDAEAARRICEALRAGGIEVWFDRSELRGGDAWDESIRRQIRECTLFIAVISAHTQARSEGYFRREWKLAVDRTDDMAGDVPFLLPIVIDATPDAAARVPERFKQVQWTRLPDGDAPAAFIHRVTRLLSTSSATPDLHHASAGHSQTTTLTARPKSAALPLIAAAVVAIGVAGFAAVKVLHRHGREPASAASTLQSTPTQSAVAERSIAVLPFVDMSEKKDQEVFSDGLPEEMIDHLSNAPGEALAQAQGIRDEEQRLSALALSYWAVGRRTESDAMLHQLESKFGTSWSVDIADFHAYRGDAAGAVQWLERAYEDRRPALSLIKIDPLMASLKADPRFKAVLRKMKLPE